MKVDTQHKGIDDTLPNGFERYKYFAASKKFTRLRNGMNRYKTKPHHYEFRKPNDGYYEVYAKLVKENKKKISCIPFID